MKLRIPDKHALVQKGDHFFHSSYLAAEAALGHGPLQWLAAGALACILLDLLMHWIEG